MRRVRRRRCLGLRLLRAQAKAATGARVGWRGGVHRGSVFMGK
jgi:hypothetical protein